MQSLVLATPPLVRLVDDAIFDAFGWCAPSTITLRAPTNFGPSPEISSRNPPGMAFVFRRAEPMANGLDLPREYAHLHVPRLAREDEWALAPWGIDAATDGLYDAGACPTEVFELAAETHESLFWGLHDWVHFHHHGPFERIAETEVQCDLGALAWIATNLDRLHLSETGFESLAAEVFRVTLSRFEEEGRPLPNLVRAIFFGGAPCSFAGLGQVLVKTCIRGTTVS